MAFSWDGAKRDNYDIYVKVIGAESPLRLTSDPAPDRFPAWSPDGRQIAFTRLSSEMETVYLISPLGGPERGVAEMLPRTWWAGGVLGGLEWSPDGRSLFLSARDSVDDLFGIHRLSIDTGVMTRFTSPPADVWPRGFGCCCGAGWSQSRFCAHHSGEVGDSLGSGGRRRP